MPPSSGAPSAPIAAPQQNTAVASQHPATATVRQQPQPTNSRAPSSVLLIKRKSLEHHRRKDTSDP
jgi:hypothetical protein